MDDAQAIRAIIARQFSSLSWSPAASADWASFAADFSADASLYPAARPAERQTVEEFLARMKGLAQAKLSSFKEVMLGAEIRVFGNVAVATAACEITENESEVNRGVEMLLLIKNGQAWQIVAQAWDSENSTKPIPADLLVGSAPHSAG
jgi:hypothetical protein